VAAVDDGSRVKSGRDQRYVALGYALNLIDEADRLGRELVKPRAYPALSRRLHGLAGPTWRESTSSIRWCSARDSRPLLRTLGKTAFVW
jgi:hypothetical protein